MVTKYWQVIRRRVAYAFLLILFLAAACMKNAEDVSVPSIETPTVKSRTAPLGVVTAHHAALKYVESHFDVTLPASETDWSIYNITPVDVIGSTIYRLTADSCMVTVSYPLTTAEATIYHVVLDDPSAGLYWEGDIDAQGEVVIRPFVVGETAVSDLDTLNIVALTNLRSTIRIELCKLDWACYTPLLTIDDPDMITALIDALDTDLPLVPHAKCPAAYQIRFVLADEQHHTFGYTCEMKTPVFLRGSQDFWNGQDGVAPDAFNEILLPLLTPVSGG